MSNIMKPFLTIVITMCVFGFMGVVNAELPKLADAESGSKTAISNLLTGKEISSDDEEVITNLESKYKLYTQYKTIDKDTYSQYKQGKNVNDKIKNLISDPSVADLQAASDEDKEGVWRPIAGTQVAYADLAYDSSDPTGYLVVLVAQKDEDDSLYIYKNVYQATSPTSLALYSTMANANEVNPDEVNKEDEGEDPEVNKEDEGEEEPADEEEKADTNPETGISDAAMYIAPLAIVLGSALYLKRRNA